MIKETHTQNESGHRDHNLQRPFGVSRVLLKIKHVDTSRDHWPPRSLNLKSTGIVSTRMLNTNSERLLGIRSRHLPKAKS